MGSSRTSARVSGRYQGRIVLLDPNASIQRFVIRRGDRPSSTRRRVDSSCGPLGVTITISWPDSSSVLDGARADRGRGLESFGRVGRSRRRRGQFLAHPRNRLVPRRRRVWGCRAAEGFGEAAGRSWRSATLRPNPTWCPSWTPRSSSRRTDVRPPWIVVLPGVRGDLPRRWSSVREHLRRSRVRRQRHR